MVFNCYIDEAGDEGIETGGSRWFILGTLIVDSTIDLQTSTAVSRIKERFRKDNKWVLQWKKLKSHSQKLYICQELQTEDWSFTCIVTDKEHPYITKQSGLKTKYALYFYSARLLLERLSWYARDNGNQKALPIFEYRSNTSYDDMRDYFHRLRNWVSPPPVNISWSNVEYENFEVLPKKQRRLLQASDNLCGMVKDAFEYDGFGNVEPRYLLSVGSRLYRRSGNLFSYGLKLLHANARVMADLKDEYEWLKKI